MFNLCTILLLVINFDLELSQITLISLFNLLIKIKCLNRLFSNH